MTEKSYKTKDGNSWRRATGNEWDNTSFSCREILIIDGGLVFVIEAKEEKKCST